ncbi:hypothetical protein D3C81_924630 [compost metagenome]
MPIDFNCELQQLQILGYRMAISLLVCILTENLVFMRIWHLMDLHGIWKMQILTLRLNQDNILEKSKPVFIR